jgi:hypothetical protein
MSEPKQTPDLTSQFVLPLLFGVIGAAILAAFPGADNARYVLVVAFAVLGLLVARRYWKQPAVRNLVSFIKWAGRRIVTSRRATALVASIAVLLMMTVVGVVEWHPPVNLAKTKVSCTSPGLPVPSLCAGRGRDYQEVVITVSRRNPFISLLGMTLTDQFNPFVGPSSVPEEAKVSGPPGETTTAIQDAVPSGKWVHYRSGSTVEFVELPPHVIPIPDSSGGQGPLFLGLPLRDWSGSSPLDPQAARKFAYLIYFSDAPPPGQTLELRVNVENVTGRGAYDVTALVSVGELLRVRLDLQDITDFAVYEVHTSAKIPVHADSVPTIAGFLSAEIATVSGVVTARSHTTLYLNYVPGTTMQSTDGNRMEPVADADQVGALFTSDGIVVTLSPGVDLHQYFYFDLVAATRPSGRPFDIQ